MKINLEDNVPIPEDYKYASARGAVNWLAVFRDMQDGVSFFAKGVRKGALVGRFAEFKRSLPAGQSSRYTYVLVECTEDGEAGCRFWMKIAAEPEAGDAGDTSGKRTTVKGIVQSLRNPPQP